MSEEQSPRDNPNSYLFRPIRELFYNVVAPVAGQSRDFNFICRGDEQFEAVESRLHDALVDTGILAEDEYDVVKHITTPEKDGNLSYITGELQLHIPKYRHTGADIEKKAQMAINFVQNDGQNHYTM